MWNYPRLMKLVLSEKWTPQAAFTFARILFLFGSSSDDSKRCNYSYAKQKIMAECDPGIGGLSLIVQSP